MSIDILQIQNDSIGHGTITDVTITDSGSGRHIGPGRQSDRKNFHDRSALYAHLCSRRRKNLPDGTKIGSFKPETVNNLVRITGKLVEQRIDEAYLTEWEAQVKAQTAEKHGTTEQGCASEQKARGEAPANSIEERITNFRQRIADRQAKEGKNYLSFYYIEGDTYEIVE